MSKWGSKLFHVLDVWYTTCVFLFWCLQVHTRPIACLPYPGLLFLTLLTFFESLKVVLINMDDARKIGYPKILWNKRYAISISVTAQKIKFSIKDFFSILSYLLKKSLVENFIFCAVCPWHHQQNFIMWLKLYSNYGPVTKNWYL